MKKKNILWVLLFLITHALFFVGGSMRGRQITLLSLEQEFENSNSQITLSHYSEYRDIALDIQAAKYSRAKCDAELMATAMFDGLANCLESENCKRNLSKKAREFAPEVW
jgi:hypothetical protein